MPETKKNTRVKAPQKPLVPTVKPPLPNLNPQFQQFKKPIFKGPNFSSSNAFRNQNRGSGGK